MNNPWATKLAAALLACLPLAADAKPPAKNWDALLESRTDAKGTTTYWGSESNYEIVGPGMTAFLLRQGGGKVSAPLIRVAYVSNHWLNVRSVTFTVGERTYGPFSDVYSKPTKVAVDGSTVVETMLFPIDSDEGWQMLEGIGEADELGRPVIMVFEGDSRYGVELDPASKRATGRVLRAYRAIKGREP